MNDMTLVDSETIDYSFADAIDRMLGDVAPRDQESVRDVAARLGYLIVGEPAERMLGNDKVIVVPPNYSSDYANYRIAKSLVQPVLATARAECEKSDADCYNPPELCEFVRSSSDALLSEVFAGAVMMPRRQFEALPEFVQHDANMFSADFEMPLRTAIIRAKVLGFTPV